MRKYVLPHPARARRATGLRAARLPDDASVRECSSPIAAERATRKGSPATTLTLTAAVRSNGGALPLFNGEIPLNHGLKLGQLKLEPRIAAYRRMVRGLEFDVCELAPTTYLCARAYGRAFTAIPVSLSRGFHHRSIVTNAASGIKEPTDLAGKRFGVRAYTVTTRVWARGVLHSEYGVDPASLTWYTDDEEHVQEWPMPPNVVKLPEGESLAAMIAAGKLDAALPGAAERAVAAATFEPVPLFANAAELEADWYRRTRIYPIHGHEAGPPGEPLTWRYESAPDKVGRSAHAGIPGYLSFSGR